MFTHDDEDLTTAEIQDIRIFLKGKVSPDTLIAFDTEAKREKSSEDLTTWLKSRGTVLSKPINKIIGRREASPPTTIEQTGKKRERDESPPEPAKKQKTQATEAESGDEASSVQEPATARAKQSIIQPPLAERSAEIPDLTKTLVASLGKAKTKAEREAVLTDLFQYLVNKQAVDDPTLTRIAYIHQINKNNAVTASKDGEDNSPVTMTFYKDAFEQGNTGQVAALYSTMRHELIHVGQRLMAADEEKADGNDVYLFQSIYDVELANRTLDSLQIPLEEIETHTFELVHADETGIKANKIYFDATAQELVRFAQKVITCVSSPAQLSDKDFQYWKEYLDNAVAMLIQVYSATPATHQPAIHQASADLQQAITARTQPAITTTPVVNTQVGSDKVKDT